MTQDEIRERVQTGYYQPPREQFHASRTPEHGEITRLKAEIAALQKLAGQRQGDWVKEQRELEEQRRSEFKQHCLEQTGLLRHPKGEAAWSKAWDERHGDGLWDVYLELLDLAELLL